MSAWTKKERTQKKLRVNARVHVKNLNDKEKKPFFAGN